MQRYKWLLTVSACVCIFTLSLCLQGPLLSFAQNGDQQTVKKEKENLFVLIDKLEKSLPFTRKSVSDLTGLKLTVDPHKSDDYKVCSHTAPIPERFIKQVSVLEPTTKMSELMSDDGTVVIDLNQICRSVALKDILARFGKEAYVIHHRRIIAQSNLLALGYVYMRPWGRLEFELEPNSKDNLAKIYLESYQLASKAQIASSCTSSNK